MGSAPFIMLTAPLSASSPDIITPSSEDWLIASAHTSTPTAMGRSNEGPSFFMSAGARLIV